MGKYQLLRKLATGGMAEVFLARSSGPLGFEKHLVVKRILPHLAEDPHFVEMFLSEAKLAARLNHANIVQIFDFGMEGGSYFIAMEYVDGVDLRTLKRRAFHAGTPISFPICARLMALACEGLAYAHELTDPGTDQPLHLIHRDISPDNIFVSNTGGLKILDFGIAKATTAGLRTQSGVLKGKVPYMAPEYLLGERIDARTDIYALGVVLFELLVGHRPYRSDNEVRLIHAVLNEPLPDVRNFRQGVPEQLVHILSRALAKDRDQRYGSCREFHADLERFLYLYSEPVGAIQIARFVRELTGAPLPKVANESIPTTPEPRLLLEDSPSAMKAPRSVVTRRQRAPPSTERPGISDVETHQLTAPVTAPTVPPASPPPGVALAVPHPSAPPAVELETVATPRRTGLKRGPRARAQPPREAEEALVPRYGWLQRNPRWWVPAALMTLMVCVALTVNGGAPPQENPTPIPRRGSPPEPPPREQDAGVVGGQELPSSKGSESHPSSATGPTLPGADAGLTHPPTPVKAPEPLVPAQSMASEPLAVVRVTSSLPGEVSFNGVLIGKTPIRRAVRPGRLHVSIRGIHQGDRFNKEETLSLEANEYRELEFRIQRLTVILRGRPDDIDVLEMDGRALHGQTTVNTYEGVHLLRLLHPQTQKTFNSSCTAVKGEKFCKFFVKAEP
jgi:serine/threonine-protein kinase